MLSILESLRKLHEHLWGQNVEKVVHVGEKAHLIIDLAPFRLLQNYSCHNILFIRDEYKLAYKAILENIHNMEKWGGSAFLVTGQPGNGKTLLLTYLLILRLQERQPVAFQLPVCDSFALFDEHGVTLHPPTEASALSIPSGAWALADAYPGESGPCYAFYSQKIHVIYTSSPKHHRWKGWEKEWGAVRYIMDVWSKEELQILLTICDFNVPRGVALFQKYGPNARLIIQILMNPSKEDEYLYDVQARATKLAHNFSTIFSDHENLNFSFDEIFILKPDLLVSRQSPILTIPTAFLFITLGIAVSRQTMALKQCFFTTLRDHPHLGSPAGWLFKNYAHICFSAPNYTPFVGYLPNDPNPHTISTARQIITGSTKLKNIQGPFNFYWQPREPHFPGVDAIIRSGDIVWALQFTISSSHKPATEGLNWLYKVMNHKTNVDWRLVIVGPDLDVAKSARDQQNLTVRWGKINIYACELPLGCFDEDKLQQLQVNLNKTSKTYPC